MFVELIRLRTVCDLSRYSLRLRSKLRPALFLRPSQSSLAQQRTTRVSLRPSVLGWSNRPKTFAADCTPVN